MVKIYNIQMPDAEYICTEYEPLLYTKNAVLTAEQNITAAEKRKAAAVKDSKKTDPKTNDMISADKEGTKGIYTLLQVKLITGRSHQIRAHLASIGHPLIGDFKYGDQKTNHYFKVNYGLSHQLLHSYRMVFPKLEGVLSYLSGKKFEAEVPELFLKIKEDLFG
jgi:23S rRNA pseudouridine955/2504/2580 synthase